MKITIELKPVRYASMDPKTNTITRDALVGCCFEYKGKEIGVVIVNQTSILVFTDTGFCLCKPYPTAQMVQAMFMFFQNVENPSYAAAIDSAIEENKKGVVPGFRMYLDNPTTKAQEN